jgi:carboxylesterase
MAIKFSFHLSSLFKPSQQDIKTPDNGLYMQGNNGRAVLLIHGLTGTPHEMRFIASYLNRNGYTVSVPRLAKHGTHINILKKSKWQEFYKTIKENYLEIRKTHNEVYVTGLSMGALLAVLLADEFKEIAGVSCLAPTLFYDGWNCPWYRCFLPFAYVTQLKYICYFKEEPPYGVKNKSVQRMIHEFYAKAKLDNMESVAQFGYPYFPVSLFHQLEKLANHLTKRLPHIDVPIQLIHAQEDDMASVRNSQFIYERVRSTKKELVLLQNSYHIITADQERETVAKKMTEFFNSHWKTAHV